MADRSTAEPVIRPSSSGASSLRNAALSLVGRPWSSLSTRGGDQGSGAVSTSALAGAGYLPSRGVATKPVALTSTTELDFLSGLSGSSAPRPARSGLMGHSPIRTHSAANDPRFAVESARPESGRLTTERLGRPELTNTPAGVTRRASGAAVWEGAALSTHSGDASPRGWRNRRTGGDADAAAGASRQPPPGATAALEPVPVVAQPGELCERTDAPAAPTTESILAGLETRLLSRRQAEEKQAEEAQTSAAAPERSGGWEAPLPASGPDACSTSNGSGSELDDAEEEPILGPDGKPLDAAALERLAKVCCDYFCRASICAHRRCLAIASAFSCPFCFCRYARGWPSCVTWTTLSTPLRR
jgi:hypothetical protein